jgi:hypothetical protein
MPEFDGLSDEGIVQSFKKSKHKIDDRSVKVIGSKLNLVEGKQIGLVRLILPTFISQKVGRVVEIGEDFIALRRRRFKAIKKEVEIIQKSNILAIVTAGNKLPASLDSLIGSFVSMIVQQHGEVDHSYGEIGIIDDCFVGVCNALKTDTEQGEIFMVYRPCAQVTIDETRFGVTSLERRYNSKKMAYWRRLAKHEEKHEEKRKKVKKHKHEKIEIEM